MVWTMNDVEEGMPVTSTDGQKIGKVIRCDDDSFVVEKGALFHKDYELRYEYISDIKDGEIEYRLDEDFARSGSADKAKSTGKKAAEKVSSLPRKAAAAAGATAATAKGSATEATSYRRTPAELYGRSETAPEPEYERSAAEYDRSAVEYEEESLREAPAQRERMAAAEVNEEANEEVNEEAQEMRIPLMQEEANVEKFAKDAGHVRIHKAVRTEEKHFSVPVRKEELVIEHIAATGRETSGSTAEGVFEEQTLDIALQEEDVRIGKRTVVREEVVVRKVARSVEKDAAASLRSEDLEIEDTRLRSPQPPRPTAFSSPTRH
jgi:uncharacterized protein (TIGR02271 family)